MLLTESELHQRLPGDPMDFFDAISAFLKADTFSDTAAKRYCIQLSTADGDFFEMVTFARTLRTAAYMPNANGELERLHQEISKLCRLHFLHPHQVLHFLNTPAIRSLIFSSANNESARFRTHEALSDHDDDAAPDDAVKTWVAQRAAACPAPPPTERACRLPVFHLHQDLLPGTSAATRAGVLAPNLVHFFSPTLPPRFFSFLRSLFFPIITLRRGGEWGEAPS